MKKVKLAELHEDPANVRTHSEANLKAISASLTRFGQQKPIVIDEKNVVRAGNGTLAAARSLGWEEISVAVSKLEGAEMTAYAIADNRSGELAEWDDKALAEQLAALDEEGIPYDELGFEMPDEPVEADEKDDEVPEDAPAVVKRGEVWKLGSHRVMCGDSTSKDDVDRLMGGEKADMVFTDPPYGIDANNQTLGSGKKDFKRGGDWDKSRPDIAYLKELAPNLVVWGGNYFSDILEPTNNWLCWHKKNDGLSFSEFELAWTNVSKQCRILSHHWSGEKKDHPTQKPLAVMVWALSFTDDKAILDPFCGSGSTLIACEKTKRKCYGMEIDPHYCDIIIKRWEDFTGLKAERA